MENAADHELVADDAVDDDVGQVWDYKLARAAPAAGMTEPWQRAQQMAPDIPLVAAMKGLDGEDLPRRLLDEQLRESAMCADR